MKFLRPTFLVLIVALLLFWGYRVFFPSDEKIIRKQLDELAETVSFGPDDSGIRRLAKQNKFPNFFSRDIMINIAIPRGGVQSLHGRDDLLLTYQAAQRNLRHLRVRFLDVHLQFTPEKESATAHFTALADLNHEKHALVQELKMELKKVEGDWLISEIHTVETVTRYR